MEKVFDFKVAGDIELQIGDEYYYDENGVSTVPQYTLETVYKNVEGEVKFSMADGDPYALIFLSVKGLPGGRRLVEVSQDTIRFIGEDFGTTDKELGCDTASYLFNGFEVRTGADGRYGQVIEFTIDGYFAGVYIYLSGPILMGATIEELHATISAGLRQWIVEE